MKLLMIGGGDASRETPDWRSLAHRTEFEGIEITPWSSGDPHQPRFQDR
jgi:hypothetical protein